VWLRKNGSDVSNTNSRFGIAPRKSIRDPYHTIGALNLFVQLDANDYVELYWRTTNTTAAIQYYADTSSYKTCCTVCHYHSIICVCNLNGEIMSLQNLAQHLAAHGRGNDKMLMHVTPAEVAGLQSIAMAAGGSLSVNPQTGLPRLGSLILLVICFRRFSELPLES